MAFAQCPPSGLLLSSFTANFLQFMIDTIYEIYVYMRFTRHKYMCTKTPYTVLASPRYVCGAGCSTYTAWNQVLLRSYYFLVCLLPSNVFFKNQGVFCAVSLQRADPFPGELTEELVGVFLLLVVRVNVQ